MPGVLTAAANRCAAAMPGFSHSWIVSRSEPGTAPVGRAWLVKGTALPARIFSAGLGDAWASPLAPAVMPAVTTAAPSTATSILALDMGLLITVVRVVCARIGMPDRLWPPPAPGLPVPTVSMPSLAGQ